MSETGAAPGGDQPGTELAEIERAIGTPAYWRDDTMQARYRDLIDAREAGATPPAAPSPAMRRLAEITALMGDHRSAYWRGPDADALQAEYRGLVEADAARQPSATPAPAPPAPPAKGPTHRELIAQHDAEKAAAADAWRATEAQARERMPSALVAEWDQAGDFTASLRRAQDAVARIVADIAAGDPEAAADFTVSFGGLPDSVRAAVLREAAAPAPGYVKAADDAELTTFRTLDGGPEIIAAWGSRARRCVAICLDRFHRAVTGMPEADRPKFTHWWRAMTPGERMAVFWALGSAE